MTVRVERADEIDVPAEAVWNFISDPEQRASVISFVDSYEATPHGMRWQLSLPIPLVSKTITVETRDVERDPPSYVRFRGRSKPFQVEGEHEIEATSDTSSRVTNRFVVDGKLPGVERFFEAHLDEELRSLFEALRAVKPETQA